MVRIAVYCFMLLLVYSTSCKNEKHANVWKEKVLSNEIMQKVETVPGAARLTSNTILGYLPIQIGEAIRSEALINANENSGLNFMWSEVSQPYYKRQNSILIKIIDYADAVKSFNAQQESIELETIITKTYTDSNGLVFKETTIYDSTYIRQSQLEISNERFAIQIIARGEVASPTPLPDYLIFVFQNSYLPRLFDLPIKE